MRCSTVAAVNQIGQLLKNIETDTDRHDDVIKRQIRMKCRIDIADEEAVILEYKEKSEVEYDAGHKQCPAPVTSGRIRFCRGSGRRTFLTDQKA